MHLGYFSSILLTVLIASPSYGQAACATKLTYLGAQIPVTAYAQLDQLRSQILDTDILDLAKRSKDSGLTLLQAADLADKQAEADQSLLSGIEQTIRGAVDDASRSNTINGLRSRQYHFVSFAGDVLGAADRAYVADDWGALTNHEVAKQLRCLADDLGTGASTNLGGAPQQSAGSLLNTPESGPSL